MVNRRQGTAPVALPWEIAVDREAEVPLGVQLAWALRSRIGEGRLQPGRRLPGLRELAETIGVNLNTVRAVYQRLEQEGLLETQQGSGTYVARTAMGASPAGEIAAGAARAAIEQGVSPREGAAALYVSEPAAQPPRGPDAGRRNAIRAEIASLELGLGQRVAWGRAAPGCEAVSREPARAARSPRRARARRDRAAAARCNTVEQGGDGGVGDPVATPLPGAHGGGEDGREHAACVIDDGPTGVPGADHAAQRRQEPLYGAFPISVLCHDGLGAPDARRLNIEGPVLGVAEDRAARARFGRGRQRQRWQPESRDAQQGEVLVGIEGDRLGCELRAAAAHLHGRVLLSRHDVRVGHDEVRLGDPARALDRKAAGGADHTHHRTGGPFRPRQARDARLPPADARRRPPWTGAGGPA